MLTYFATHVTFVADTNFASCTQCLEMFRNISCVRARDVLPRTGNIVGLNVAATICPRFSEALLDCRSEYTVTRQSVLWLFYRNGFEVSSKKLVSGRSTAVGSRPRWSRPEVSGSQHSTHAFFGVPLKFRESSRTVQPSPCPDIPPSPRSPEFPQGHIAFQLTELTQNEISCISPNRVKWLRESVCTISTALRYPFSKHNSTSCNPSSKRNGTFRSFRNFRKRGQPSGYFIFSRRFAPESVVSFDFHPELWVLL